MRLQTTCALLILCTLTAHCGGSTEQAPVTAELADAQSRNDAGPMADGEVGIDGVSEVSADSSAEVRLPSPSNEAGVPDVAPRADTAVPTDGVVALDAAGSVSDTASAPVDGGHVVDFRRFVGRYRVTVVGGGVFCKAPGPLTFADAPLEIRLGTDSDLVAVTDPMPSQLGAPCILRMNAKGTPTSDLIMTELPTSCAHGATTVTFEGSQNHAYNMSYTGDGNTLMVSLSAASTGSSDGDCQFGYSAEAVRVRE